MNEQTEPMDAQDVQAVGYRTYHRHIPLRNGGAICAHCGRTSMMPNWSEPCPYEGDPE